MVASASKAGSRIETSGCVSHPRGVSRPRSLMMFFRISDVPGPMIMPSVNMPARRECGAEA